MDGMITKKVKDHVIVNTPTCGEIREVLRAGDYGHLDIALAINQRPTTGHYHVSFDEIYFLLDGSISVQFYDPETQKIWTDSFGSNELCLINKGIHHKVTEASESNRLCIICIPRYENHDEHLSEKLR